MVGYHSCLCADMVVYLRFRGMDGNVLMNHTMKEKGRFKMMKTCKVCGLKYQTMAEDGHKYCHKCTLATFKSVLTSVKPVLFEYSTEQLDIFAGMCLDVGVLIANELNRRSMYFARMMEQRKPR